MAKDKMKTLEIKLNIDLKVKVDPSQLETFEARLADNAPRDAAASQLLHSVTGKNWLDTVPNRRMLLADSVNLKAVLDAAGFKTSAEKKEAFVAGEKARLEAKPSPDAGADAKRPQASSR